MNTAIDFEDDPAPMQGDLRENAERWIAENPEIFGLFERFALELAGLKQVFGINFLRERVRWECAFFYGNEPFKITNSYSPYIARELVRRHPHLAGHMKFRRTKYER